MSKDNINKIKLLVMDVDGTLTDGRIYMGNQGEMMKAFNVRDGHLIVHLLPKLDIIPAVITGRVSKIVENRCRELGISHLYQGRDKDKPTALIELMEEIGASPDETAYIGDDLNDLECMKLSGLSACPADACKEVRDTADYICKKNGGDGAVREFIEYLSMRQS